MLKTISEKKDVKGHYKGCEVNTGKNKDKLKIDCTDFDIIKYPDSGGVDYGVHALKSDGFTNGFWGFPNAKKLKDFKKAGITSVTDPRKLYELSLPDVQCTKANEKPKENQKCYICDIVMKNIDTSGFAKNDDTHLEGFVKTGRQCEHVIPVLLMTMICGLYSSNIESLTNQFFRKYKYLQKFKDDYIKWRKEAWELGYLWSHTECNMIKNENPFLKIRINYNFEDIKALVTVKETRGPTRENINIKRLFQCLLQKKDKWCGMYRKFYKEEIISELEEIKAKGGTESPTDTWINHKYEKLHDNYLSPLIGFISETKNPYFFLISILILRETIFDKLGIKEKNTKLGKIFNDTDKINTLFKNSVQHAKSQGGNPAGGGQSEESEDLENNIKKFIIDGSLFQDEEEKKILTTAILLMCIKYPEEYGDLVPIFNNEGIYKHKETREFLLKNLLLTRKFDSVDNEYIYDWSVIPQLFQSELKLFLNESEAAEGEEVAFQNQLLREVILGIDELYGHHTSRVGSKSKGKRRKSKRKSKRKSRGGKTKVKVQKKKTKTKRKYIKKKQTRGKNTRRKNTRRKTHKKLKQGGTRKTMKSGSKAGEVIRTIGKAIKNKIKATHKWTDVPNYINNGTICPHCGKKSGFEYVTWAGFSSIYPPTTSQLTLIRCKECKTALF